MDTQQFTRAFRHRNYRLFFSGQSISLIGTWLTKVATSWLVFNLSHSAWTLGLVGFVGQLPTFLLAPFAGVMVDRWPRHKVLVITQILAMIQSALLAILTLLGHITVPQILALSAFQGLINAFDTPARQAFVVEMVEDRQDLPNAIAMNSSMVNMAKLVGPSVAGILIAAIGIGWCFGVDAISYIAVLASLLAMKINPKLDTKALVHKKVWTELGDGLRYSAQSAPIRSILLLLALTSLMGMPYMVLLPVIVQKTLHGDATTLGYLTGATGFGALFGVYFLASRKSVLGLGKVIPISTILFGVSLALFALSANVFLSMGLLFLTGLGMMLSTSSSNTILQTIVDEDKRGRVMSLFTMAVFGMLPFGSLLGGWMASTLGAEETLIICGLTCVAGAFLFRQALPEIRAQIRPIYQRLGILPQVTAALSATTPLSIPPED